MNKDDYKELRKKLKDIFVNKRENNYNLIGGVGEWLKICGIKPTEDKLMIVFKIFGSVPYPYQQKDRLTIIEYLNNNKFKDFKNEFGL